MDAMDAMSKGERTVPFSFSLGVPHRVHVGFDTSMISKLRRDEAERFFLHPLARF